MATSKQITLIHIARQQLDIDEVDYREILQSHHGVSSSRELNYEAATELINFFVTLGFKPQSKPSAAKPIKKKRPSGDNIILLATPAQHSMIADLRKKIVWHAGADGFKLWLKKRFKLSSVKTSHEAQSVIEGLKGMLRRI